MNNILVNRSIILFWNKSEIIKNNKKYTYGTHDTPTTNDLCVAISMLEWSNEIINNMFEINSNNINISKYT